MNKTDIGILLTLPFIMAGCSNDIPFDIKENLPNSKGIRLYASIDQLNPTRANDLGFADGDKIGIYAVNYENGVSGALTPNDNLATNVGFTYQQASNCWTGDRDLYFMDEKTPVDFYGYYPYQDKILEVESISFSVAYNQTEEATPSRLSSYEASDFLWAKSMGVTPDSPIVNLSFRHIMAGVEVRLIEGAGYEPGEWSLLEKSILVDNTILDSEVSLSSGEVKAVENGEIRPITANPHGDNFRAVTVPQTVEAGKRLVTITVDGQSYSFARSENMEYTSGKLHKFTIEVSKRMPEGDYQFKLLEIAVTPWESDLESHNGNVKEYVVVDVASGQSLEEAFRLSGINPSEMTSLKVTGTLTEGDFRFLNANCQALEALNMKEAILRNCNETQTYSDDTKTDYTLPHEAFKGMLRLTTFVFPDKLKIIGDEAFRNTNLSGKLSLPEGLERIGAEAFNNWQNYTTSVLNLTGELSLPSTLKYIGRWAFNDCDFSGDLIIPEGVEEIGEEAFIDCDFFNGELRLPSSLKSLGDRVFMRCKNLKGDVALPRGMKYIPSLAGMDGGPQFNSVTFPDAPIVIDEYALSHLPIKGHIVIPSSVDRIRESAFSYTDITGVTFPENLLEIEKNAFFGCKELTDTVYLPEKLEIVPERIFINCSQLQAVVIPKGVLKIKGWAFENCHAMTYLRCLAPVPPELDETAFTGVEKDNFVVEVPEESVDLYRNAPGWREFKRIASYRNFIARPSKYNVLNKGGEREIILNADGDWTMTECPDWVTVTPTSGSKKTTLTLKVGALSHGNGQREGKVSFKLKDSDEHTTHINVGQYDYEYEEDGYIQLQKATKGNGINLFFCGDGYDAIDISSGIYLSDMKQEMEYMFAVEPFITYRDYFNVYTAFAMSEESGIEDVNHWRTTKFHTKLKSGKDRAETDWDSAFNYPLTIIPSLAERLTPTLGVIIVSNTEIYEGKTAIDGDSFVSLVTKSSAPYPLDARGEVQHEACGHGIGLLADEYVYHQAYIQKCQCVCCQHLDGLKAGHSWGFGLNVWDEGGYKKVPWSHLIFDPRYGDIVDIYEGGYFHSRGVYRNEYNSCMNNNVAYFSAWQRELIVRSIKRRAGEEFDFEEFARNDNRNIGKDFTDTRGGNASIAGHSRCSGPEFIKSFKIKKSVRKGGKK